MRELTFNLTEDKRYLAEPTNVENFNLTFDKPNWVQGRVGEDSLRQVFVNVVTGPNNEPYDLTGINPEFDGLTAKGGPEHRNYVVIDNHHSVMIDAQGGRFRFDFPKEAFAIAGSYKQAFFSLKREGTGEVVATLEFDMKVMANFVYENVVAFDYVTPFEDLYHQLEQIIETANGDITSKLAEWQTTFQNKYNELQQLGIHTTDLLTEVQSRLNDLAEQIESKDLMTKTQAMSILDAHDARISNVENHAVLTYPTIAAMKSADLKAGQTVKVLGNKVAGDVGTMLFTIQNESSNDAEQLTNGKFAKYVRDFGAFYNQNEVTYDWDKYKHSIVHSIRVKKYDEQGNRILPVVGSAINDSDSTATGHAIEHHTTLTVNGLTGYYPDGDGSDLIVPAVISNGEIIHDISDSDRAKLRDNLYLGIDSDGNITEYRILDTTAQQMLDAGEINVFQSYGKLVENGVATSLDHYNLWDPETGMKIPTIAFGVYDNGDYGVVAVEGRTYIDFGITYREMKDYLVSIGMKNAWALDGGGSVAVVLRGSKVNSNFDENHGIRYTKERTAIAFLDFTKEIPHESIEARVASQIAEIHKIDQVKFSKLVDDYQKNLEVHAGKFTVNSDDELDEFLDNMLNKLQYVQVVGQDLFIVSGVLQINYRGSKALNSSDNQRLGTYLFKLVASKSPEHMSEYGGAKIVLESQSGMLDTHFNVYTKKSGWLGWHAASLTHWLSTYQSIAPNDLSILQSAGGLVWVGGTVHAENENWTKVAVKVPLPKYSQNSFPHILQNFVNSSGGVWSWYIDDIGDLYVRKITGSETSTQVVFSYPTTEVLDYYLNDYK